MNDKKNAIQSGQTYGDPEALGSFCDKTHLNLVTPADDVTVSFENTILLQSYDWTSKLSEIRLDLKTINEFKFSCLFHFVVDTPVAAAQDHPAWQDDVVLVFTLSTQTGAFITSMTHMFRRGCGRYLHEVPDVMFTSQVAWPIRNLRTVALGGHFRLRVTAC